MNSQLDGREAPDIELGSDVRVLGRVHFGHFDLRVLQREVHLMVHRLQPSAVATPWRVKLRRTKLFHQLIATKRASFIHKQFGPILAHSLQSDLFTTGETKSVPPTHPSQHTSQERQMSTTHIFHRTKQDKLCRIILRP